MIFTVFPGQASQYPGMGKDWFENFNEARQAFEEASDFTNLNLTKLCFEGSEADLKATEITQPAILTTCIAIWRSLKHFVDFPALYEKSLFAGHSLGEYTALVAMGSLGLGEAARFVRARGAAMQEAVPAGSGAMMALLFKPKTPNVLEQSEAICKAVGEDAVWIANINAPEQIVLAGKKGAIDRAQTIASSGSYDCRQAIVLEVSAPFHCPLMGPAAERLKPLIDVLELRECDGQYIANVDARVHTLRNPLEISAVRGRLFEQITGSVRWVASSETALMQGCKRVLEVGPKKVLSGLCKRIEKDGLKFELSNLDRKEDISNVQNILSA
jgi:[acyl-carrier-protein] S-malonyltransferase